MYVSLAHWNGVLELLQIPFGELLRARKCYQKVTEIHVQKGTDSLDSSTSGKQHSQELGMVPQICIHSATRMASCPLC